jgi:hypothetical protein
MLGALIASTAESGKIGSRRRSHELTTDGALRSLVRSAEGRRILLNRNCGDSDLWSVRALPSLQRLCAISTLVLCLSCSSKDETPGETLAGSSLQQVAKQVLAKLLPGSAVQAPVEAENEAPAPDPAVELQDPGAGNLCPPDTGPVTMLIVDSERAVKSGAAQYPDLPVLHRDAETVIFEDGRVITADVEAAGDRLNELGWNGRELQLVSSMPRRYAFSGGGDWRAGSGTGKSKPRKRRRRRG